MVRIGWTRVSLFIVVILLYIVILPLPSLADQSLYGKQVKEILFRTESPFNISYLELIHLIPLSPGAIVTRDKVRESMESLNSKGLFKNISVYADEEGGEVILLFILEPAVLVTSTNVHGSTYFSPQEILGKVRFRRGVPVGVLDIEELREAMNKLYRENGYFKSRVNVKVGCRVETGTGDMSVEIHEGLPPYMKEISIEGNEHIPDEEFIELLRVKKGEKVNLKKIMERLNTLAQKYKRMGYLFVNIKDPELHEVENGVSLSIRVSEGPKITILFKGNRKYGPDKLKKVAGLIGGEVFSEIELADFAKNHILTFYEEKGYPFSSVEAVWEGSHKIAFHISEGEKGYIKDINFHGNESILEKELLNVMDTTNRKIYSMITGSGVYHKSTLEEDFENIRGYYQSKGYPNAKVKLDTIEKDENSQLSLNISISEGKRYVVKKIVWKGVTFFTDGEIRKILNNREGSPVNYVTAFSDTRTMQKKYLDRGFIDCKVGVKFATQGEKGELSLIYEITEGQRFYLGRVVVTGNSDVSSDVILREIPMDQGEPVGEEDLIEFQQRLYRTGLLSSIKIKKIKDYDRSEINLFIHVKEARFLLVEGGVGYGTETGYRGSIGLSHNNIDRYGRTLGGTLSISEIEDLLAIRFREPWVFGVNMVGGVDFTFQRTENPSENFIVEKLALTGSLTKEFWERSSTSLQVEFERSNTKEVSTGAVITPEDLGLKRNIIIRPILIIDLRDDPFFAKKGSFYSLVGEVGSGFFGSDTEYVKVNGQSTFYYPVKKRFVFVVSGRAGYAKSLRTGEVPIEKRFFIGGRTTVRGFRESRLGPKGVDGSPIGGDTMVIFNGEIRYLFNEYFVVGLFLDSGSAWLRDVDGFGFSLRETGGISFKYLTPAGPVSLDVGFKLDRKPEEPLSEYHFTIGAVF